MNVHILPIDKQFPYQVNVLIRCYFDMIGMPECLGNQIIVFDRLTIYLWNIGIPVAAILRREDGSVDGFSLFRIEHFNDQLENILVANRRNVDIDYDFWKGE